MNGPRNLDTRRLLLEAAAELIAAAPGQNVPLRAICARVGVRLPTLYHFFGSKEGLLEAVVEYGFERYLSAKARHESTGDPIQDIRDGWDAHVAFGLANPGFYALMYGQVAPGRRPAAQDRPTEMLLELTRAAAEQGRLVVSAEQAAEHVLATNVGVTLRQITSGVPNPAMTAGVREATLAAITGLRVGSADPGCVRDAASALLSGLPSRDGGLPEPELQLLMKWLAVLARGESIGRPAEYPPVPR